MCRCVRGEAARLGEEDLNSLRACIQLHVPRFAKERRVQRLGFLSQIPIRRPPTHQSRDRIFTKCGTECELFAALQDPPLCGDESQARRAADLVGPLFRVRRHALRTTGTSAKSASLKQMRTVLSSALGEMNVQKGMPLAA